MDNVDVEIRRRLRIVGNIGSPPWRGKRHISRNKLAEWFNDFGYKTGAEIGVRAGHYSERLCLAIPGLKLYCVDPYQFYKEVPFKQRQMDKFYQRAKNKLSPFDVTFIVKTSLDASFDVPDGSLDFVYIDANHTFDNAMMDLILWYPKIRSGGIISGHDFIHGDHFGVVQAVTAFANAHRVNYWYLTNTENAENTPSFFWVKP